MTTQLTPPLSPLPLTRAAIKPNHTLRAQADRLSRLSLDQELTGSFAHIEMIEDALRDMNGAYNCLLREYSRAGEMEKQGATRAPKTRA